MTGKEDLDAMIEKNKRIRELEAENERLTEALDQAEELINTIPIVWGGWYADLDSWRSKARYWQSAKDLQKELDYERGVKRGQH